LSIDATTPIVEPGEIQESNTDIQQADRYELIELRRGKVLELLSRGLNQSQIAKELGVDKATISRDVKELRAGAKERIKTYVEETLPFEHEKALTTLNEIVREAWDIYHNDKDSKTKLMALSVVQSAVNSRLQALGDPESIRRAIKVITQLRKQLGDSSTSGNSAGGQQKELEGSA
jgi:predicted transcriptional regulator